MIPEPVRPADPDYEDVESLPDQAHEWRLDEDGERDVFAVESGYHNGPGCQHCDYAFCHHCNRDGYADLGCLRRQADQRNDRRRWAHEAAMKGYAAQWDYYRKITASLSQEGL